MNKNSASSRLAEILSQYGDLLYDLTSALVVKKENIRIAFPAVVKQLKLLAKEKHPPEQYRRSWILANAIQELRALCDRFNPAPTLAEQMAIEDQLNINERLHQFHIFFNRLNFNERVVLLMKDKYGIPYSEIASTLGLPEDGLRLIRQQALSHLEEGIWSKR